MKNETPAPATLDRFQGGYNPFRFDGYCVEKIKIYDPSTGEIIAHCNWFTTGTNNRYLKVNFDFPIIKKMKEDFTRNYAYFTTYKDRFTKYDILARIEIAIPANLLSYEIEKNIHDFDTDTTRHFYDQFTMLVNCQKEEHKIEDGELIYFPGELKVQPVSFRFNPYSVNTDFGNQVETIAADLKSKKIDIDSYNLEKLLKSYKVTAIQ